MSRITRVVVIGLILSVVSVSSEGAPRKRERRAAKLPKSIILPFGSVADSASASCPSTALSVAGCRALTVTNCLADDGTAIASQTALVKITDPADGTYTKSIVALSGGDGGGPYESSSTNAQTMLVNFTNLDYRVMQVWYPGASGGIRGWSTGGAGPRRLACRPATIFNKLRQTYVAPTIPFLGTGNSGGSAQLSYVMAFYQGDSIFDGVIPSSGPPMGDLAKGCMGFSSPGGWDSTAQCGALTTASFCATVPTPSVCCGYSAFGWSLIASAYNGSTDCQNKVSSMVPTWQRDSVNGPGGSYNFPHAPMRFIFGGNDSSEAVPLGQLWRLMITSDVAYTVIAGAPHECLNDVNCNAQIIAYAESIAVFRH